MHQLVESSFLRSMTKGAAASDKITRYLLQRYPIRGYVPPVLGTAAGSIAGLELGDSPLWAILGATAGLGAGLKGSRTLLERALKEETGNVLQFRRRGSSETLKDLLREPKRALSPAVGIPLAVAGAAAPIAGAVGGGLLGRNITDSDLGVVPGAVAGSIAGSPVGRILASPALARWSEQVVRRPLQEPIETLGEIPRLIGKILKRR